MNSWKGLYLKLKGKIKNKRFEQYCLDEFVPLKEINLTFFDEKKLGFYHLIIKCENGVFQNRPKNITVSNFLPMLSAHVIHFHCTCIYQVRPAVCAQTNMLRINLQNTPLDGAKYQHIFY